LPVARYLLAQGDRARAQQLLHIELTYIRSEKKFLPTWEAIALLHSLKNAGLLTEAERISNSLEVQINAEAPDIGQYTGPGNVERLYCEYYVLHAQILAGLARLTGAEEYARRALILLWNPEWVEALKKGPESLRLTTRQLIDNAFYQREVALILESAGKLDEAEQLLEQAFAANQRLNNQGAVLDRIASARIVAKLGRLAEAEQIARQALSLAGLSYGTSHPQYAITLDCLAAIISQQDRAREALPLLIEALRTLEQTFGPKHVQTVAVRDRLRVLERKASPSK
jgi:tetratricopeptide (TPR) repeat protein